MTHGKLSTKQVDGTPHVVSFINNAISFMFEEISYDICCKEIDRTENDGITTT